jgi:diacylglycerol kinase (ATP)
MSDEPKFSLRGRLKSFHYAGQGILFALKTQHNAWVHFFAAIAVGAIGFYLEISLVDWRWLIMAICLVWSAELMNTAFEYLCDVISPEFHISVKRAKDIAAGAVLVCVIAAILIGLSIFPPYLL